MTAEGAADYFHQRPFDRVLHLLRHRFVQLGRVGGTFVVSDPTPDELKSLRAFVDPNLKRRVDGSVILSLREFEDALRASRFGCGLREALEAYFGGPLNTRAEEQTAEAEAWGLFCLGLGQWAPPGLENFARGYKSEWRHDPDALEQALHLTFRAVANLPQRSGATERLPVFANRVAGNPHAFDAGLLAGRLLEDALEELYPQVAADVEGAAARRSLLLAAGGLARDDLSSTVLAVGLDGSDPLLAAARATGAALAYPLRTVAAWRDLAPAGQVFVVENPAVFGGLLDGLTDSGRPPGQWPVLVCTSGQPSAAAISLLDLLVRAGAHLYYSGDFDVGGLRIARSMLRRYGGQCSLWQMDEPAYRRALATGASNLDQKDLDGLSVLATDLPELVAAMQVEGLAAFQEALLPGLLSDIV